MTILSIVATVILLLIALVAVAASISAKINKLGSSIDAAALIRPGRRTFRCLKVIAITRRPATGSFGSYAPTRLSMDWQYLPAAPKPFAGL
ncbi:hypothetical protein [Bradyrhizobium sp. McL0615]|jgi:hypothetical protein|uniref:hypothetical protein n=1 Tax=Bradyrhizobium sp. McL0615 TaxID=3415673 RepID=UPI003CF6E3E9